MIPMDWTSLSKSNGIGNIESTRRTPEDVFDSPSAQQCLAGQPRLWQHVFVDVLKLKFGLKRPVDW
jgi:hypothetical protein